MTDKTPRPVKGLGSLLTLKINVSSSMFHAIPRLQCSGKLSCIISSPCRSLLRSSASKCCNTLTEFDAILCRRKRPSS